MDAWNDLRNASVSEVCARVAFRLIQRDYWCYRHLYKEPARGMGGLSRLLDAQGWACMATWVRAYAAQWSIFHTVAAIRDGIVDRARYGASWRHAAYAGYKATRGADPRVTNRGVSSDDHPRDEQ